MEKFNEALFRATLHDFANILAGIRGIIDLNPPTQPMPARDRDRLVAVVDEGVAILERSRHLALETMPGADPEPGPDWRRALQEELGPLGVLFRCRFELTYQGDPCWDFWPGRLLRGYVRAITRQALPMARPEVMAIACGADADGWRMRWSPVPVLPESLAPGTGDRSMDVAARWARVGTALAATTAGAGGALEVRLPRTAPRAGSGPVT
jgi:hypothetical protein